MEINIKLTERQEDALRAEAEQQPEVQKPEAYALAIFNGVLDTMANRNEAAAVALVAQHAPDEMRAFVAKRASQIRSGFAGRESKS